MLIFAGPGGIVAEARENRQPGGGPCHAGSFYSPLLDKVPVMQVVSIVHG